MKQKFKELSEAFEELETSVSHRDYFFKDKVNALVMELLGWSQVNKDNLDQIVKNYAAKIAGQFYHLEHTGSLDKEFSKVWEVIGEVADGDFEMVIVPELSISSWFDKMNNTKRPKGYGY